MNKIIVLAITGLLILVAGMVVMKTVYKKSSPPTGDKYTCPEGGYVGCMPELTEEGKIACSPAAMEWYKKNCPDFKGAAL